MLGYLGGFLRHLALGATLDLAGGDNPHAWGMAFMHLGIVVLVGLNIFQVLRPRDLAGERAAR